MQIINNGNKIFLLFYMKILINKIVVVLSK